MLIVVFFFIDDVVVEYFFLKLFLLIVITLCGPTDSFTIINEHHQKYSRSIHKSRLQQQVGPTEEGFGKETDIGRDSSSSSLFQSFNDRQKELKEGIGKRYIARTQRGFLNVHNEPTDPFDTDNIVDTLSEGQIVTSIGPSQGLWINHDAGGWSVSKFGNFTWLEPIQE